MLLPCLFLLTPFLTSEADESIPGTATCEEATSPSFDESGDSRYLWQSFSSRNQEQLFSGALGTLGNVPTICMPVGVGQEQIWGVWYRFDLEGERGVSFLANLTAHSMNGEHLHVSLLKPKDSSGGCADLECVSTARGAPVPDKGVQEARMEDLEIQLNSSYFLFVTQDVQGLEPWVALEASNAQERCKLESAYDPTCRAPCEKLKPVGTNEPLWFSKCAKSCETCYQGVLDSPICFRELTAKGYGQDLVETQTKCALFPDGTEICYESWQDLKDGVPNMCDFFIDGQKCTSCNVVSERESGKQCDETNTWYQVYRDYELDCSNIVEEAELVDGCSREGFFGRLANLGLLLDFFAFTSVEGEADGTNGACCKEGAFPQTDVAVERQSTGLNFDFTKLFQPKEQTDESLLTDNTGYQQSTGFSLNLGNMFHGHRRQLNAAANLETITEQASQGEVLRLKLRFGLFQDAQTAEAGDIKKQDVEGALCQIQYFMSQLVQNATNSRSVHAQATEIVWGLQEDVELPVHLNFTVEVSDAATEGDTTWLDDRILVNEMEKLDAEGLKSFLVDWVWKADPVDSNFFQNANRLSFDASMQEPVTGQLKDARCPETEAPTMAPTATPSPSGTGSSDQANGPNGQGSSGYTGNASSTSDDWPFGPNYSELADLDPMATFSLKFAMFGNKEMPPTLREVDALMCQVNSYCTQELRRKLSDGTIHVKAVFIDYFFYEEGAGSMQEDIVVNFTAFAYYGKDEHDQVPAQVVFQALKLNNVDIKDFVENYVWKSEPEQENIFFHTEALSLDSDMGGELPTISLLIEASGCVLPRDDDGSPFGGIAGPSSPSSPIGGNAVYHGDENLGLGGDAKTAEITFNFRVSNLENIKQENAVKASGLDASIPIFADELVQSVAAERENASQRYLKATDRRLRVVPIPGTASVEVQEYACPSGALPGLTCHSTRATFEVLTTSDEEVNRVEDVYSEFSERAAADGTFNDVLQRVDPETPLYIGIMTSKDQIPPGSIKRGYDGEPEDDDASENSGDYLVCHSWGIAMEGAFTGMLIEAQAADDSFSNSAQSSLEESSVEQLSDVTPLSNLTEPTAEPSEASTDSSEASDSFNSSEALQISSNETEVDSDESSNNQTNTSKTEAPALDSGSMGMRTAIYGWVGVALVHLL